MPVLRTLSNRITKRFTLFHKSIKKEPAPVLRQLRGDFLEQTVLDTINAMNIENVTAKRYDKIKVISPNGRNKLHGTDIHVYNKNRLHTVIECKSYIDSCFYSRTCSDMNIFKLFHVKPVNTILVTLEDAIREDTKHFYNELYNKPIDHTFILSTYKRSNKPFWERYRPTKGNKKQINDFVKELRNILKKE